MLNIVFTDTIGVTEEYKPKPSSTFIPDWYKNMQSYLSGEKVPDDNGFGTQTIKRCMPVFDAICSGYIIELYTDVWVKQKPAIPYDFELTEETDLSQFTTQPLYEWASFSPIQFHSIDQAPTHPSRGTHGISYPKWINPWSIKTPPGYSTLFVQPLHRESPFTIMPGIVDTDKYTAPVNFPFVLNNSDTFSGLIPAGTPIAQVIPFKRESWEMEIGSLEDLQEQAYITKKLRTKFFDSYKTQYRSIKEYK